MLLWWVSSLPSAASEGAAVVLVRVRFAPNLGRDPDGLEKLGLLSSLAAASSSAAGSAVVLVPGRGLAPKRPPNFLGLVSEWDSVVGAAVVVVFLFPILPLFPKRLRGASVVVVVVVVGAGVVVVVVVVVGVVVEGVVYSVVGTKVVGSKVVAVSSSVAPVAPSSVFGS